MPARLSHYEIRNKIGSGAMGVVFHAWDCKMHRDVAIKVLHPTHAAAPRGRARFMREAWAEAALNHPNVATCYDIDRATLDDPELAASIGYDSSLGGEVDFLCMEYVPGQDLRARIHAGVLKTDEILDIGIQVARGLQAAHASGVVHRDLKPGNVRLTSDGQIKILDFGLAQFNESEDGGQPADATTLPTQSKQVAGTPGYMSPEQASGVEIDARSDLFSLGVLLYELVTGHRPYEGASVVDVQHAIWSGPPPPMTRYAAQVPKELERLVEKLLAPNADDRYQTARGVLADLERLAGKPTWTSPTAVRMPRPRRRLRSMGWMTAVAAVAVVALIGTRIWEGCAVGSPKNLTIQTFQAVGNVDDPDCATSISSSLVTELSQIEGLNVVTFGSVASMQPFTIQELARAVDVRYVLEGLLRQQGHELSLDVHLVEGESGSIEWSKRYRVDAKAPLSVCPHIVTDVAFAIAVDLTPRDRERLALAPTRPLEAYNLYALGRQELEKVSEPGSTERALSYLQDSLEKDPEFALARAGLAAAYLDRFRTSKDREDLERARREAMRAVTADPELLDGRIVFARVLAQSGDLPAAEAEFEAVLRINPERDDALFWLALLYQDVGRLEDAKRAMRQALEIRPEYWRHWNRMGDLMLADGDFDAARLAFERAVEFVPAGVIWPYENLAVVELRLGNYQRAEAIYDRLPDEFMNPTLLLNLGMMFYSREQYEEAAKNWLRAAEMEPQNMMHRINLGDLYYLREDLETASRYYREAVALLDAEIELNPADMQLRLWRDLCLSKSGGCAAAIEDIESIEQPPVTGEGALICAVVYAACRDREKTLDALARALDAGCTRADIRIEPAFAWLAHDEEYRRLSGAGSASIPKENDDPGI
jgi:tetratricopeptide (TPR) repeat protein/TolB-like protein